MLAERFRLFVVVVVANVVIVGGGGDGDCDRRASVPVFFFRF